MINFGDERLPERFWSKVLPEPNSGCWLWTSAISHGYGVLGRGTRLEGNVFAHRLSFETLVSVVPSHLELDHLCRVRCCVNPAHLEPVTHAENIRRGMAPTSVAARHASMTHCPAGHPYDAANTYLRSDRWTFRACRKCVARRQRERTQRKRAAARVRR